jgi:hypothetical protein
MGGGGKIEDSTIQTLMSLSRGITNINPLFSFTGLVIDDAFDTIDNLGWRIGMVYATQAIVQTLKIVGSAEILGDPVGAIATLGSSVRVFVKKTKSELKGHSQSLGGGLKNLVQVWETHSHLFSLTHVPPPSPSPGSLWDLLWKCSEDLKEFR